MDHTVRVATVEAIPTAVVRATTIWDHFPALWRGMLDEVWDFAAGGTLGRPGRNVMLYRESDAGVDVEVGTEVDRPFEPWGRVVPSALPGGKVAMTLHRGGYERLSDAHHAVGTFCEAEDLAPAGPRWEIYGHIRDNAAEPETEIFWLLR